MYVVELANQRSELTWNAECVGCGPYCHQEVVVRYFKVSNIARSPLALHALAHDDWKEEVKITGGI